MKSQLVILSKTAGWIVFSLGVIHTANTILVFLFMYIATGLACLLAGSGMLISVKKEIRDFNVSRHLFMISAIFMLLLGIGAPIAMSNNPFGYISLIVGVFATAVAMLRYKKH